MGFVHRKPIPIHSIPEGERMIQALETRSIRMNRVIRTHASLEQGVVDMDEAEYTVPGSATQKSSPEFA